MDGLQLYTRSTSLILISQSIPLLFTPRMILWLLCAEPRTVTPVETFFARSLAINLLLVAFLNLLFSGEIARIFSSNDAGGSTSSAGETDGVYAKPTLYATLVYHVASGVLLYSYSLNMALSGGWLTSAAMLHLVMAAAGLGLGMFGTGPGHISRRTGADKRTSGFPFKNSEADKRKVR